MATHETSIRELEKQYFEHEEPSGIAEQKKKIEEFVKEKTTRNPAEKIALVTVSRPFVSVSSF